MNIEISDFSLSPETGREDENIGVFQQAARSYFCKSCIVRHERCLLATSLVPSYKNLKGFDPFFFCEQSVAVTFGIVGQ